MKARHLISWILQLTAAAILVMAALGKFTGQPDSVALFQQLDFDPGGRLIIGGLELVAALLLLIPQSIAWGAILGWGLMSGALIAHLTRLGFSGDMIPLGLMAISVWVACTAIIFLRRNQSRLVRTMFARRHPGNRDA